MIDVDARDFEVAYGSRVTIKVTCTEWGSEDFWIISIQTFGNRSFQVMTGDRIISKHREFHQAYGSAMRKARIFERQTRASMARFRKRGLEQLERKNILTGRQAA